VNFPQALKFHKDEAIGKKEQQNNEGNLKALLPGGLAEEQVGEKQDQDPAEGINEKVQCFGKNEKHGIGAK
jgi:hypothetical protein